MPARDELEAAIQKQALDRGAGLGLLIGLARRRLKQAVGRHVQPFGLSPQQFWCLITLGKHPGLSLRELALLVWTDAPTASRVIQTLSRRRLVRALGHPVDRRRNRLMLTPRGSVLARRLERIAEKVRALVREPLSRAEQQTLRRLLLAVIVNLDGVTP